MFSWRVDCHLLSLLSFSGPLYVVVEYAPNGNLRQFLRDRRPTREYQTTLTLMDLVSFAYQIVRGMEYLSSKKVYFVNNARDARNAPT